MSVRSGLMKLGCTRNTNIEMALQGKTARDFQIAIGNPVMVSDMGGGNQLIQWRSGGGGILFPLQTIAVLFDANNQFVKVSSRYQV